MRTIANIGEKPSPRPIAMRARERASLRPATGKRVLSGLVAIALLGAVVCTGISSSAAAAENAPETLRPTALAALVGAPRVDFIAAGDTLLDVADRHRLGFERITRLNPELDPWIPPTGSRVRLPTHHILPDAPAEGLVVNLPELQLYDFTVGRNDPEIFALAIGDELDPSLVGRFRIGRKRSNPVWNVPASIRAERPELPAAVPPGPDNPLGPYWLTIGQTSYGIHGTNNRWSIGREATHGCLRLYNDEIARLFPRIPTGTPIRIVYQTVKLGERDGILYVEAHPDRYGRDPDRVEVALAGIAEWGIDDEESIMLLRRAIDAARGEPIAISVLPD